MKRAADLIKSISPQIYSGIMNVFVLRAVQMGLGFVNIYLLSRALTQDGFGHYQFILSAVGILTIFCLPGIANALVQAEARGDHHVLHPAQRVTLLSSIIGAVIIVLMGGYYYWDGQVELAVALGLSAVLFPATYAMLLWQNVLTGKENFRDLAKAGILNAVATTVILFFCLYVVPGNWVLPVLITMLVPTVQNMLMTARVMKREVRQATTEPASEYITYGINTSWYQALGIVAQYIDKVLLFYFLSPAALAIYVAADKFSEVARAGIKDISAVLAPRFARHSHYSDRLDYAFWLFAAAVFVAIAFASFLIIPWLLPLVFGNQYQDSVVYAQWLLFSVAIGNIAVFRIRYIQSKLDEKSMRDIMIYTNLSRIIASLILIPLLGLKGAVISAYIFRTAGTVIASIAIQKHKAI